MSVVGFDIGNENCAIAVAKHGGIHMLLNEESKGETPAVVSFSEKQRFLGSSGAAFATKYPKSTISQIKRLIGKLYKDPSVQKDLRLLPFETREGSNGGVLIDLEYLKKKWTFMPVEILGMLFAHLKKLAEKNLGFPVVDCVIGIPSYFTDLQRREYLNAASIAGLRPLKLMHDCTAVALGYGMYKTDVSNKGQTNVVFVDIGHSDTQVMVAAFRKGKMTVLSHAFDQSLGGRDFDEVLYSHFAAKFKEQYGIDVCSNARASIRLRVSCENLKKVLSANTEARLNIECLVDDKDLNGFITREEFECLSLDLLDRVSDVCCKAANDSGLSGEEIHSIELVGSGSRIPSILRKLTSLFGKEPVRTLNGSECVARGCALRCAMLSPTSRVQDYKVQDILPYSIGLRFVDGENKKHTESIPFAKVIQFPINKTVPYHGHITSYCQVFYNNKMDLPNGISPLVGYFLIGPSQTFGIEKVLVKVKVQINIHGIVEIESASIVEEKRLSSKLSRFPSMIANILNDHKPNGSIPSTAHLAEEARKGSSKKTNLTVSQNLHVVMTNVELYEAQEMEQVLAEKDIKVEQIKEKRNTLESFIYETRSKLSNSYRSVATDSEEEFISKLLQKTEEWLYEERDNESQQVYIGKLEDLKKVLAPIENRYEDELAKKAATKAFQTCIQENRLASDSLPPNQQKEVNNECLQAEKWLIHLSQYQDSLPKNVTRLYFLNAINDITQVFKGRCKDIMVSKSSCPSPEV